MIYPISFSIPSQKILDNIAEKRTLFAAIIPGIASTYIYNDEQDYYNGYRESVFGKTKRKAGWDCLRHYEILANGCIPYFEGLNQCPTNTMTHFPKELVKEAMATLETTTELNSELVKGYCQKLLDYTREHLSTKAMASYVLRTIHATSAQSVLYLSHDLGPDYLRCLTLIGFKELFGKQCHDYPGIPHIYTTFGPAASKLYGKGISYTNILDKTANRDDSKDSTIESDICSHKYDVVVYGSIHRGSPFWDLVTNHYSPSEIVLLCGEDLHACNITHFGENYNLFIREL